MIELATLRTAFGYIGNGNHPISLVFFANFVAGGIALSGQRFEKTALHDKMIWAQKGIPEDIGLKSGTFSSQNDRISQHSIEFKTSALLKRAFDALIIK